MSIEAPTVLGGYLAVVVAAAACIVPVALMDDQPATVHPRAQLATELIEHHEQRGGPWHPRRDLQRDGLP